MGDPSDLTCQEFVELVTEYLEGSLSTAERTRFEAHIDHCDPCVVYLEQIRQTIRTLGHLSEEHIAPEARDQLLAAFRHWNLSPGFAD